MSFLLFPSLFFFFHSFHLIYHLILHLSYHSFLYSFIFSMMSKVHDRRIHIQHPYLLLQRNQHLQLTILNLSFSLHSFHLICRLSYRSFLRSFLFLMNSKAHGQRIGNPMHFKPRCVLELLSYFM